MTYIMGY